MRDYFHLWIPGRPVPWARTGGSGKRRFLKAKQADNKATLRAHLVRGTMDQKFHLIEGGVFLALAFYFKWPRTRDKWRVSHDSKPDLDNLVKQFKDAGNGFLWHDDAQVNLLFARKCYGDPPGILATCCTIHYATYNWAKFTPLIQPPCVDPVAYMLPKDLE